MEGLNKQDRVQINDAFATREVGVTVQRAFQVAALVSLLMANLSVCVIFIVFSIFIPTRVGELSDELYTKINKG